MYEAIDYQIARRIGYRIGWTGRSPFIGATDKAGPVSRPPRGVEVEVVVACHHHDRARYSTRVQYTRIEVNGYTDTSGTPKYNQGLSIRRAQAVQAELVKDGVPQGAITIQGFGDTHLLVPTGPGVREPQNRRVEIIIR